MVQRDRKWYCYQFITPCLCNSFLLTLLPTTMWSASHRRQSFMKFLIISPPQSLQFFINCSSVDPFPFGQSFRNRLLQCGLSMGSQVLPPNQLCVASSLHIVLGPAQSLLQYRHPMCPNVHIHLLQNVILQELWVCHRVHISIKQWTHEHESEGKIILPLSKLTNEKFNFEIGQIKMLEPRHTVSRPGVLPTWPKTFPFTILLHFKSTPMADLASLIVSCNTMLMCCHICNLKWQVLKILANELTLSKYLCNIYNM